MSAIAPIYERNIRISLQSTASDARKLLDLYLQGERGGTIVATDEGTRQAIRLGSRLWFRMGGLALTPARRMPIIVTYRVDASPDGSEIDLRMVNNEGYYPLRVASLERPIVAAFERAFDLVETALLAS